MLKNNIRMDNSQKYVVECMETDYPYWSRVWDNETETILFEGTEAECRNWLEDMGIDSWQDVNWSDDVKYDEE